jgi:hypothetical protein
MTYEVTYRTFQEEDLPGLLRLWQQETEWGVLTAEEWRRWYVETPFGDAAVVVAVDRKSGEVAGQTVFAPSLLSVNGREVPAFRVNVPILARPLARATLDSKPFDHPIAAMYLHGIKTLGDRRRGLIYAVPNPRWLRALQVTPFFQYGTFPLWSHPLPLEAPLALGPGFTAGMLEQHDKRIDGLWEKASRLHGCQVVRNSRTLPYKVGSSVYAVLGVSKHGELAGLAVSRSKGDGQWLICDVLSADAGPSLRATLAAACNLADEKARTATPVKPISKVALLTTPTMELAARELGFARDTYEFPLVVHVLDETIRKDEVAPPRWYVSAND